MVSLNEFVLFQIECKRLDIEYLFNSRCVHAPVDVCHCDSPAASGRQRKHFYSPFVCVWQKLKAVVQVCGVTDTRGRCRSNKRITACNRIAD